MPFGPYFFKRLLTFLAIFIFKGHLIQLKVEKSPVQSNFIKQKCFLRKMNVFDLHLLIKEKLELYNFILKIIDN